VLDGDDHAFIRTKEKGGVRQRLRPAIEMRGYHQPAMTLPAPFPRLGGDVEQDQYFVSIQGAFEGEDIVP
jgi:hypothetical protein